MSLTVTHSKTTQQNKSDIFEKVIDAQKTPQSVNEINNAKRF